MKLTSASFFLRARWFTWCSSSTSSVVRSLSPAAAMQRTTQRLNALLEMIRPNSNSESCWLLGDTRCADETNRRGATGSRRLRGTARGAGLGGLLRPALALRGRATGLLVAVTAVDPVADGR